jgi:DinB superfamily
VPPKSSRQLKAFLDELISHIREENAHAGFDAAVECFPADLRGARPHDLPHSAWQLVEHLRIAQWDIIEYARNPKHKSPRFPDGYWPQSPEPPDDKAWERSLACFRADRKKLLTLIKKSDLLAAIPHANKQSLASKTILLIDHNAYHLGQLMLLRRLLHLRMKG